MLCVIDLSNNCYWMTVSECGGVMKNIYNTSWKPNHVSDDEVGEVKEIHKLISSECIFY